MNEVTKKKPLKEPIEVQCKRGTQFKVTNCVKSHVCAHEAPGVILILTDLCFLSSVRSGTSSFTFSTAKTSQNPWISCTNSVIHILRWVVVVICCPWLRHLCKDNQPSNSRVLRACVSTIKLSGEFRHELLPFCENTLFLILSSGSDRAPWLPAWNRGLPD